MPLGSEIKTEYNDFCGVDNQYAYYDGYMTSYLPWHNQGMGPDSKDGETALIKDGKYYILNGNWMLTYSELASKGFQACLDFFLSKAPHFASSWSNYPEPQA